MPTLQEQALARLSVVTAEYNESCALLEKARTPTQRLSRQTIVKARLHSLNMVRAAAGLAPEVGPRLLSVDELLQPKAEATPEALQAALAAAEARPGLLVVVGMYEGTTALAA